MNREESLEVKTSFGSAKATGGQVVFVVLVAVLVFILGYQQWTDNNGAKERSAGINKQINELKDAIIEQTYILTLTTDERTKLRMDMPESLRRKIGR